MRACAYADAEIDRNRYRLTLFAGRNVEAARTRWWMPSNHRSPVGIGLRITLPGCGTNRKYGDLRKRNPGKHGGKDSDLAFLLTFPGSRAYIRIISRISLSSFVEQIGQAYFSTRKANFLGRWREISRRNLSLSLSLRQSRPVARQSEVDVNSDQCCRLVDPMDFEFAVTGRACARHTLETGPEDRNRSVRYTLASRLGHERNHCSLIFSPPSPYSLDYPRSVLLSRIVVLN